MSMLLFRPAGQRVAIVDGAAWIREQMQLHLAELHGLGLDFYHLGENVHRARREVFGEDSPAGRGWADELMHVFQHQGYNPAWERLVQWRSKLARSPKRKAADRLLKYVAARQGMIRYPAFRAQRWWNHVLDGIASKSWTSSTSRASVRLRCRRIFRAPAESCPSSGRDRDPFPS
jgi:hypothetical protein